MTASRSSLHSNKSGPLDTTDPAWFAAQFREAYPRLAVVAAAVLGSQASAEDVVQDAAIIAYQKVGAFVPGSNFTAWLVEIVRRCALNHRRKRHFRRTYAANPAMLADLEAPESFADDASPVALASGRIIENQTAFDDQLVAALNQLSEDARCCLLLRTVERLSYAEIGALLGMPEGTAMSHVHRSRTAMRRVLLQQAESGTPAT
jgi:RNA polymerase sigma-70 factor (ECF subfamily)